ncbi:NCS2 family permease [Natribacillus halophilus]|uniref:Putative MFS transporter, AGZA family, xanthine/uracil permease n=1 Tax=Natribacillus halophilus TaxID=549003 RepID=A0A1G8QHY1_9BACI|nr:NCS2 family permease [Natribacillus halophilus]SDJ04362.1 putative MFS transporter, AGZA family, xanthine/uracil permease [Natribacillus halophilus]
MLQKLFQLDEHGTTVKQEVVAGITIFFAAAHIIIVNPTILSDGGIPFQYAMIATVLVTVIGSLLMGLYANVPLALAPGMGINAFFVYTLVQGYDLSWQMGVAVVIVSGVFLIIAAFTPLAAALSRAVPTSLKYSISAGIGLLLVMIGLQMGEVIVSDPETLISLAPLESPSLAFTLFGLLLILILYVRRIRGAFVIGLLITTAVIYLTGFGGTPESEPLELGGYLGIFTAADFSGLLHVPFWMAVFSLTLLVLFDTLGLVHGLVPYNKDVSKVYQSSAINAGISGFFGTSPTVLVVESAAGMSEGGKTGLTAVTAGLLFLTSFAVMPFISGIPEAAIAPILMIVGMSMAEKLRDIPGDFTEWFPAGLTAILIPLTYSIIDGLAAGFILYPLLKWVTGRRKDVHPYQYVIALLFICNYALLII